MCSFLLGQHNKVNRFVGLTYSYPYRRRVPVFGTLGKSCAVDNDDLPPAAAVSKNAERCVLITALCQLRKPPVEFLSRSVSAIARNLKHCCSVVSRSERPYSPSVEQEDCLSLDARRPAISRRSSTWIGGIARALLDLWSPPQIRKDARY